MHARLITLHLKHGHADGLERLYRESILPALRRQKGFVETNFGLDKNGKAVAFVVFETEADALLRGDADLNGRSDYTVVDEVRTLSSKIVR